MTVREYPIITPAAHEAPAGDDAERLLRAKAFLAGEYPLPGWSWPRQRRDGLSPLTQRADDDW